MHTAERLGSPTLEGIAQWIRNGVIVATLVASCAIAFAAHGQTLKVELVPNLPHTKAINNVRFSRDGMLALSGSIDKTVKLWDLTSRRLLRTLHTDNYSLAFSPDGSRILVGGWHEVTLWETATGRLLQRFSSQSGAVYAVAFDVGDERILSGHQDGTVRLWSSTTGELLHFFVGHSGIVNFVAFTPNRDHILSGDHGSIKRWDSVTETTMWIAREEVRLTSTALSPDGTRIVSGGEGKLLTLRDASTGQLIRSFEGHEQRNLGIGFSRDGRNILAYSLSDLWKTRLSEISVKVWDTSSGTLILTSSWNSGHSGIRKLAFSPDGSHVLSGGEDRAPVLWTVATGKQLGPSILFTDAVSSFSIFPDGTHLVSGGSRGLKLWNAQSGMMVRSVGSADIRSVAVSPDGSMVASVTAEGADIFDASTGRHIRTLQKSQILASVAFAPDGTNIALADYSSVIKIWNLATGQVVRTISLESSPRRRGFDPVLMGRPIAYSPDGAHIALGTKNEVKLWNSITGGLVRVYRHGTSSLDDETYSIVFSIDGTRLLSSSYSGKILLWDVGTGKLLRTFEGNLGAVYAAALSRDGKHVASGGRDRIVRLWDALTGKLVRVFEGHFDSITSVTFSPNGRQLLSAGSDGTARVWNLATGEPLVTLFNIEDGWLTMTPAGFFAAPGRDPVVAVVRGLDVTSMAQIADHLYRPDLVEQLLKGDPELKYEGAAKELNLEKILDSGPAPQIEVIPERKTELGVGTVRLAARIVDAGGGIDDKVVWRVNGITQGDPVPPTFGDGFRIIEQTMPIRAREADDPDKRDVIEVTAYNKAGLLASLPLRFEVDRYVTTEPRPKMHILALGVSKYAFGDWKLDYAAKDADTFANTLQEAARPIYDKVSVTVLTDSDVTFRGIDAAFRSLRSQVAPEDVFVLFVAGHGRNASGTYFFLPQDMAGFSPTSTLKSHAIGQEQWQAWLAMIPAQKSVLVFDTCESSAAAGLSRDVGRARETAMDRLRFATGRSVITAARQAAYEGYKGHGVLTYAILEALSKREAGIDELDLVQLAAHIDLKVPEFSHTLTGEAQRPHFKIEGNFPIGVRKAGLLPPATGAAISVTPTHVVIRAEPLRLRPATDAPSQRTLDAGTLVRVLDIAGDWALIARDGQKLGYVPVQALVRTQ